MGIEEELPSSLDDRKPPPSVTSLLERQEIDNKGGIRPETADTDPNLITWASADDPANPLNWSKSAKWKTTLTVSGFSLISLISMTMAAPALPIISGELEGRGTNEIEQQMVLSVFLLAYAFGPMVLGPLSEEYGRLRVLQAANLWFLVFNTVCGFSMTRGMLIATRFLAGLGASVTLGIGAGTLSDCWRAEERGKSLSVYTFLPLLGPAIGPIAGGFIVENTTWRWIFWSISVFDVAIIILSIFYLRETYGPTILHRKVKSLREQTTNPSLHTIYETTDKSLLSKLHTSLQRPLRLLITQPIIQTVTLYLTYNYGLLFIVVTTFPTLWTTRYHESTSTASLNYIAMVLGETIGSQLGQPLNDRIYDRLKARAAANAQQPTPEFRVPLMLPGALFVPIGLLWYGWSAQARLHWIMPDIGICIFSIGSIMGSQAMTAYIVDSYSRFTASAMSAATLIESLAAFAFPLFAPALYAKLGFGVGNTVLAGVAIVIGIPAPLLLWRFGPALRSKSRFAIGELES